MQSPLQNSRSAHNWLRRSAGTSITVVLIVVLTLAIDVAMFANFCKTVIHHLSCSELSRVVKVELEATEGCMCGLYSQIVNEDDTAATSMHWLKLCRAKV
jgi:hypothetical protein